MEQLIHAKNESEYDLVAEDIKNSFGFHPARKQIAFQFPTFNFTFKKWKAQPFPLVSSGLDFFFYF